MRRVRAGAAVALAVVAGLTCKDLVGVSPETAIRFVLGTTTTGEVEDANEPRYYEIAVKADSSYAILVEALEGAVLVRVRNPISGFLTGVTVSAPSGPLERHSTGIFTPVTDAHWLVVVQPAASGPPSRFRLRYEPVRRVPESIAAQIVIGDTVEGEALYSVSDIDEFTFAGQAGQVVNAFLQALGSSQPGYIGLRVLSAAGPQLDAVIDTAGDTELELSASGRFVLPQTGTYRVVVGPSNFVGPFRFHLYPVDLAPESHAATIALGDTVEGEAIDHVGDLDDFSFTVPDSHPVYVFLQGTSGRTSDVFGVTLPGLVDSVYGFLLASNGTDSSLLGGFLGPLNLPGTGPFTVRVGGSWRGSYRALVHAVDPAPEGAFVSLLLDDSIVGEAIDYVGDVDTFSVLIPGDTWGNLVVFPTSNAPGGGYLVGNLVSQSTGSVGYITVTDTSYAATGPLQLPAGAYTLRIAGSGALYQAGYVVRLPAFSLRPESVGDTIALGDTVFGESVDVPGDIDAFLIVGQRGEHWNIRIQGLSTAADTGEISLMFLSLVGGYYPWITSTPTASATLGERQTKRIDLPLDGWYRVRIASAADGHHVADQGPYRFVIERANTTPESSAVSLAAGDTVVESLDFLGDFDEFVLTGTPGQEFAPLFVDAPLLEVFDSISGDTLSTVLGMYGERAGPRFFLPASGSAVIRVFEPLQFAYTRTGPYRFVPFPINRGPESVIGSVALGDTLRGEAIAPSPDVDEFQLLAAPGDTLMIPFRFMSNGVVLTVELVDAATGTILGSSSQLDVPPAGVWGGIGPFIMPVGGAFFRVRHYYGDIGTATYEFTLSHP